jgi:hypothetical protein
MTSKQLPSSPAIQSRYLYKYYQPIDNRLNLSYSQYATLSNRPYHNISLLSLNNDDREINGLINTVDNHQNQNEENSSDTSHHSIVSLIPIYLLLFIKKKEFFLSFSLCYICIWIFI